MSRPSRLSDICPYEASTQTLKCIGGRWKILIIRRLLDQGEHGFNELQRALPRVTAKMLAQQLQELEADEIVVRTELVSTPPKTTRYGLSGLGMALRPTIDAMSAWGVMVISRPEEQR